MSGSFEFDHQNLNTGLLGIVECDHTYGPAFNLATSNLCEFSPNFILIRAVALAKEDSS
jgi:hypothetical protein